MQLCVRTHTVDWCMIIMCRAHINTTKVSLFDTGVGQEGIDESHVHSNALKNLCKHFQFYVSTWGSKQCETTTPSSVLSRIFGLGGKL